MTINIITKNLGKLLAAKTVFEKYGITVNQIDKEYPEIQAENSLEIAKFTAIQAAKELGKPVIREDHSLFIDVLGIPGPYTDYIEKKLSVKKLLEIMKNQSDRNGYFEIATVYAEPNGFTKEYIFKVPITLSHEERGNLQTGWNRIIQLENDNKTLAEYPEEERLEVWTKNYKLIAEWLIKNNAQQ